MDDPKQPTPKPTWNVSPGQRRHARELRKKSTDAERLMWAALRDKQLDGFSFKRQVPIGPFIADFACHAKKLVVELDGGQHYSDDAERADAARTAAIEARGFRVIRLSNADVMNNRDGVLQSIATELAARALTPTLSRKRERERAARAAKPRPTPDSSD
ncbi:endonuclease domain-containing protein [Rhodopseudomonas sp. HC1]|uniref:endonuclease domain-containing protein n=1 Tax=Rhodopseudomonas infernalis TaxID=2897386 RepID=UPI001EE7EF4D|nr:endonuclease domain-containing protein [Rhodopseudomonas infernalis]MCG6206649.1 endonuclease domain-containing protein [Rhodopseudomonas infernalis]